MERQRHLTADGNPPIISAGGLMDADVKATWLERLRSDEWVQGYVFLRSKHNEWSSLGLLADILESESWDEKPIGGAYGHHGHYLVPALSLMEGAGIPWPLVMRVSLMNAAGVSFEKQADYIDEQLD